MLSTYCCVCRGRIQYDVGVCMDEGGKLLYQTTKAISDFSADALSDHGNRVFEARLRIQDGRLVKNAEPILLMDS